MYKQVLASRNIYDSNFYLLLIMEGYLDILCRLCKRIYVYLQFALL